MGYESFSPCPCLRILLAFSLRRLYVAHAEENFPVDEYLLAGMAQVTQTNNPLQDGINGQGKDGNSKYESNWEPVVGARRFFNDVEFRIKASWAGKDDKWKNVGEDEDDAIDLFQKRLKDFLGKTFPRLKELKLLNKFYNATSPSYLIYIMGPYGEDCVMINIKFKSKSLPDEDNAMFTGDQLEIIRDHIILLGEDLFGKLDPDSSFDLMESDHLKNGTFQMIELCVQPFAIGDWYCFNNVAAGSFDLGPHIKKRVIDAGLARRKVLIPHSTVVQYHSLGDMQGMPKIKLKNLPNE